jgi:chorismate mutase / prephenate dehydratase
MHRGTVNVFFDFAAALAYESAPVLGRLGAAGIEARGGSNMSGTGEGDSQALSELRARIDAIDAEMHRLLIQRGTVIDSLIRTKGTSRPGAAFRPGREADMMRRLVDRHDGALPLATVEHIWREIITTFTRVQAQFDVAIDVSVAPNEIRDLARFYFSFSVALVPIAGPAAVIAHVAETSDIGLIARDQPAGAGAWWRGLTAAAAPRITGVLPFIRAAARPANLPAFIISPRLSDPTPTEVQIYAAEARAAKRIRDGEILARAGDDVLMAVPRRIEDADGLAEIGGVFRGIALDGASSALYRRRVSAEAAS